MALSPQDQAYWKEKLGWKAFLFLLASTIVVGCVIWPLMLFIIDWSSGRAGDWNLSDAWHIAAANFPLALLVSVLMWILGQVYYWMGWLPARR